MQRSPSPLPPIIEVTVRSIGGLGDGIADYHNKPVFIPKSCSGDVLSVRVAHQNRDGIKGDIVDIISPSDHRQKAPCTYFDQCGGCSLQQLQPHYYQAFKRDILNHAVNRAGFASDNCDVHFIDTATRRRVAFTTVHNNNQVMLALHGLRSHTPVAIDSCLILRPELQAMIAPINRHLSSHHFSQQITAISLTLTGTDIDLLLHFKDRIPSDLPEMASLANTLSVARISADSDTQRPVTLFEHHPITITLGSYDVPLPADAFLQASDEAQGLLTQQVLSFCKGAHSVIDLFCGIGTYSFPLSQQTKCHAVELDDPMTAAMNEMISQHRIHTLSCEKRNLFTHPVSSQSLAQHDVAVINPPRNGARAQCEALSASDISRIVMISCSPATFARDAKILKNAGFALTHAQGIDQFVFSPHLEIIAYFQR